MKTLAACLLLIAASAPASAQSADTPFVLASINEMSACNQAKREETPDAAIKRCNDGLALVQKLRANHGAGVSPHERNVELAAKAGIHTALGGIYAELDNARTARVCEHVEMSWGFITQVRPTESPADYQEPMQQMKVTPIEAVRLCRGEKGTPPGAPPLP